MELIFQGFFGSRGRAYERRRRIWLIPLVAFLCLSIVRMGGLFWVDNSWAYIDGGQAGGVIQADFCFDGLDREEIQAYDADGDGMIPLSGGVLIRGNGGQDDNREEYFQLRPHSGTLVERPDFMALFVSKATRAVMSYVAFGHLKVMPAEGDISNILSGADGFREGCLHLAGGLYFIQI